MTESSKPFRKRCSLCGIEKLLTHFLSVMTKKGRIFGSVCDRCLGFIDISKQDKRRIQKKLCFHTEEEIQQKRLLDNGDENTDWGSGDRGKLLKDLIALDAKAMTSLQLALDVLAAKNIETRHEHRKDYDSETKDAQEDKHEESRKKALKASDIDSRPTSKNKKTLGSRLGFLAGKFAEKSTLRQTDTKGRKTTKTDKKSDAQRSQKSTEQGTKQSAQATPTTDKPQEKRQAAQERHKNIADKADTRDSKAKETEKQPDQKTQDEKQEPGYSIRFLDTKANETRVENVATRLVLPVLFGKEASSMAKPPPNVDLSQEDAGDNQAEIEDALSRSRNVWKKT